MEFRCNKQQWIKIFWSMVSEICVVKVNNKSDIDEWMKCDDTT